MPRTRRGEAWRRQAEPRQLAARAACCSGCRAASTASTATGSISGANDGVGGPCFIDGRLSDVAVSASIDTVPVLWRLRRRADRAGRAGGAWEWARGGVLPPGRRVRRFSRASCLARAFRVVRGRGERNRADIFKKRTLVTARQPVDGLAERQPVHGLHVAHQFVNRRHRAASMRQ